MTLLLLACVEYGLDPKDGAPFDTGHSLDSGAPFDSDTAGAPDTAGGTGAPPLPSACDDVDLSPVAVPADDLCASSGGGVEDYSGVREQWRRADLGYVLGALVAGDLGDGPTIVGQAYGSPVVTFALAGTDGATRWTWDGPERVDGFAAPVLVDLDGDGALDVAAGDSRVQAGLRGVDGAELWRQEDQRSPSTVQGAFGAADMDGDGAVELALGSRVFDGATGGLRGDPDGPTGYGTDGAGPYGVLADLDGDGLAEAVVGAGAFGPDGEVRWSSTERDGPVAVADLDGDGPLETIVAGWNELRVHEADGAVRWRLTGRDGDWSGTPTVFDADGDGAPEIGVPGVGAYRVVSADAELRWRTPIDTYTDYSETAPATAVDLHGDGTTELVYADRASLHIWDATTGDDELVLGGVEFGVHGGPPLVADIDGDGRLEIVLAQTDGVVALEDGAGSWAGAPPEWPQYALRHDDRSFLALPTEAAPAALPNAVPLLDACLDDCPSGRLTVIARVGSAGATALPAGVAVSLYGERDGAWAFLGREATPAEVAPGTSSAGLPFTVDAAVWSGRPLRLVVDDDHGVARLDECVEDDNAAEATPVCP